MRRALPAFALALIVSAGTVVLGQSSRPWTQPRTPDGHPDFQGYWTTQTFTPLQRPARFNGREFLNDEEVARLTKVLSQSNVDPLVGGVFTAGDEELDKAVEQNDPTHYDNAVWLQTSRPKTISSRRTSLIIEPRDGRLPALTAEGQKRAAARRANAGFDSYENRPLQERCVVWIHEGPPMVPPAYNDLIQVLQTPNQVTFVREVATNLPRVITTDNRPHLPEAIRQWGGDSRGHWEGDTLVVDTTNFNDKVAFMGAGPRLHVVERFTRTDADTIRYTFTVSDPDTWTTPWTAELPMVRTDGPLHEYTCHENNYGLANILKGARANDAKQKGATK